MLQAFAPPPTPASTPQPLPSRSPLFAPLPPPALPLAWRQLAEAQSADDERRVEVEGCPGRSDGPRDRQWHEPEGRPEGQQRSHTSARSQHVSSAAQQMDPKWLLGQAAGASDGPEGEVRAAAASQQPPVPVPSAARPSLPRVLSSWLSTGHGASLNHASGDCTQWRDCQVQLQLDSAGVWELTGRGQSLVARESAAALQFLFALERDEQEEQRGAREGERGVREEEDPSPLMPMDWRPSAALLARQPALLRVPFLLQGAWLPATNELLLLKRHIRGAHNELEYRGQLKVSGLHPQPEGDASLLQVGSVLSLQLECDLPHATGTLVLHVQERQVVPYGAVASGIFGVEDMDEEEADEQPGRAEGQAEGEEPDSPALAAVNLEDVHIRSHWL